MPTTRQGMGSIEIEELIAQRVADAMTTYKANRNSRNGVHQETSASAGGVKPTPRANKIQEAVRMAHDLMDKVVRAKTAKNVENKRKWENNQRINNVQQPNKRSDVVNAYTVGSTERVGYAGRAPLCNRCTLHYTGPCTVRCNNCKRVGHLV
ncbi:hypothetical protein Tco_1220223 [Tanacetum coccineum]